MTKEITKAYILQEIQDKFGLREFAPEVFTFQESVVPVYNIEQHLTRPETFKKTISVTSATGFLIFAASKNKYFVNGYTVVFMAAGAYKVAGIYVMRKNSATNFVYLDLKKNQTESYTVNLPEPLMMSPGDSLSVNVDDYTSTANLEVTVDFRVEDLG